jgi:hypothetical protein
MASVSKNLKSLNPIQFQVFNKEVIHLESHPELIKEEKLILKKCSGLPLAIVTIGGFLANQPKTARAGDPPGPTGGPSRAAPSGGDRCR